MISSLKPWTQTRWDWLTVRFSDVASIPKLLENVGLVGLTWTDFGKSYDKFPHAKVVHDVNRNTNVITLAWDKYKQTETYQPEFDRHVDYQVNRYEVLINITGTGLDLLSHYLKREGLTVNKMVALMYQERGQFTRVDLAHDFFNFDKHYSAKYCAQRAYQGDLVTPARYCKWITSFNSHGGNSHAYNSVREGDTLAIGKGDCLIRIYSKMAEEHPMAVDSRGVSVFAHSEYKSWQRWELQLRHTKAKDLIHQWVKNKYDKLQTWTDVVKTKYRFVTKKGQNKRSRCQYPLASWYKKIIATGHKFEQTSEKPVKQTFGRARKWLKRQVWPTLGNYLQTRIEQVKQNCGNYDKAKRIVSKMFLWKIITYLDDTCKYDRSLIDSLLTQAKAYPINPSTWADLFTSDIRPLGGR